MVLLAFAMLVLTMARWLERQTLWAGIASTALAEVCIGVVAIAALVADPGGAGLLLAFGGIMTIPLAPAILRATKVRGDIDVITTSAFSHP